MPAGEMFGNHGMTLEEVQAEVVAAAIENRQPFDRPEQASFRKDGARPVGPSGPGNSPAGVFDPDADLDLALPHRAERYVMPNGKPVWVHPCSLEEAAWLNKQALREVRQLGLMKAELPPDEARVQTQEATLELRTRGQVYQVIACCRVGPEPDAAKVFAARHAKGLRTHPQYSDAVREIAALSDRLSEGESEAEALQEAQADFFGAIESWLATCSSALSEAGSDRLRELVSGCATIVFCVRQRGKLLKDDAEMLRELTGLREAE